MGAGLLGLAHAHEALRRGLSVVVLERDPRALGASVRHSGHLSFSTLAGGTALDGAVAARERWLELAQRAGMHIEQSGTVIVARRQEELALMEPVAAESARAARMLTAVEVGALAPVSLAGVLGGFHGSCDLRLDPRSVAAALARLLAHDSRVRVEWGANVHEVEPGIVHAGPLRVRARAIVVCPGADDRTLPPALRPARVADPPGQLQMLRLAAPGGRRYGPALANGFSLLHQPAFGIGEGARELRARLELERPSWVEGRLDLLVAQLPDGDLVVGSTQAYTGTWAPYLQERLCRLLLDGVRELLGTEPAVIRRWRIAQARVAVGDERGGGMADRESRTSDDFRVARPLPGVRVVQSLSPQAMARCHTKAAEILDGLLATGLQEAEYIHVRDARKRPRETVGIRSHPDAFSLVTARSAARA